MVVHQRDVWSVWRLVAATVLLAGLTAGCRAGETRETRGTWAAKPQAVAVRPAPTTAKPPPPAITAPTRGARNVVTLTADAPKEAPKDQGHYEFRPPSRDGIGKFYMGREIAHVMGHLAAGWLERPEREREEQPQKVIDAMDLKKDEVVADIGAGTGYFAFRIAERVPEGKVLAVDIQPEMLDLLRRVARAREVTNVEPVLGTVTDPNLPADSIDVALMVDAYHEFDHPREMMEAIFKGLKSGGRVVLVEYKGEDPNVPIKPLHKMTEEQAKKEMAAVGLEHVKTHDELPWQHVMVFRKPEKPDETEKPPAADPEVKPAPEDDPKRQLLAVAPRFAVVKLADSVAYYREKLGFKVEREEHGYAVVSRDGVTIQLIVPENKPGPAAGTQFAADCDAYIWAKDVSKLHEEFRAAGALIAQPPQRKAGLVEMDVATPGGGVLRFAQRMTRGNTATTSP